MTINEGTLANKIFDSWIDFPHWEVVKCWDVGKATREIHEYLTFSFFSFLIISTPFYIMHMVLKFCLNVIYEIRITKTLSLSILSWYFLWLFVFLSLSLNFPSKRTSSCWNAGIDGKDFLLNGRFFFLYEVIFFCCYLLSSYRLFFSFLL